MRAFTPFLPPFLFLLLGCGSDAAPIGPSDYTKSSDGKSDSSALAVFLDFEFEGKVLADSSSNARRRIESQLMFTVGQLNGEDSVGRLDRLVVTDIESTNLGGAVELSYRATLPVAWGSKTNIPDSFELVLPRDIRSSAVQSFTDKYVEDCVDWSAHDVSASSMWYYYRPDAYRCELADEDVFRITADLSLSDINTSGKYPEYDRVWQDEALRVVAIFGKNEADDDSNSDAGVAAYNEFTRRIRDRFRYDELTTIPADIPYSPGVAMADTTYRAVLEDGKSVEVVALLVDGIRLTGPDFDARYESLTQSADLIAYNGHSGLGANIRALAQKGRWATGQYSIVFMNGCDTYAYVDSALFDAHAAVNPDDPNGTRYLDMVMNAMPSFFRSNARGTMSLIEGLLSYDEPMTYENIFERFDPAQVVLVSGEEDNSYMPGGGGPFEPIYVEMSVGRGEEQHWRTGTVSAGTYVATLSHAAGQPGGDADLYTRVGAAPTLSNWDCRPYTTGSREECRTVLGSPDELFVMVRGYDYGDNAFVLEVEKEGGGVGPWEGMSANGTVARNEEHRFDTGLVPAGSYVFEMSGTNDADLYVRVGLPPTTTSYGCRPYRSGSHETCRVDLDAPALIHVMVRGYAASSSYSLEGRVE